MEKTKDFTRAEVLGVCVAFTMLTAMLVGIANDKAFERGVKSVKLVDPAPLVKAAAEKALFDGRQEGFQMGVNNTVQAAQEYIQDSCTNKGELTANGVTYMCLPRQEM